MKACRISFFCIICAFAAVILSGCNKTGQIENPLGSGADGSVRPTISKLSVQPSVLSRTDGGIMSISCSWQSPWPVYEAAGTLCFVKTVKDSVSEAVGVIASDGARVASAALTAPSPKAGLRAAGTTIASGSTGGIASGTASEEAKKDEEEKKAQELKANQEFYERFKEPIEIPTAVGTNEQSGLWKAEIPFTKSDLKGAPLNIVQQMTFYMTINRVKTNTLSFEMSFTASEAKQL